MDKQQSIQSGSGKQHAVVIGASMAGLLAARALSDHFEQVTIIERDQLTDDTEPRRGVPQGRHAHALLAGGASVLGELFPDLFPALARDGAVPLSISDIRWYTFGAWMKPVPTPVKTLVQSRPFLEQHVRDSLAVRSNVRFIDACEVTQLCAHDERITGVALRHRTGEQREEILSANLVVDASGRGSRAPQWLASLGYGHVEESSVKIDVGYATRIYRRPAQLSADWKLLIVYGTPPGDKRGGLVLPMEGGCWMVTLAGGQRDYPPDDEAGFLDYARSLAIPHLYEAIKDAEPVTHIVTYKYSSNRWRHYERLPRLPEGFIVMGDAVCSFNPVYGQGMSVAALEAKLLDTCLRDQQRHGTRDGISGLPQRFQKAIAKVVKTPWMLTTGEDFRYPQTEGKRPLGMNLFNWYTRRVIELTASNPLVTVRFFQVRHLLKPLATLFHPRIVWAVLSKDLASHQQKPEAPPTTNEVSSPLPTHTMDAVAK